MKGTLSMQEYNENVKKRNIVRWTVVIGYIVAIFAVSLYPLFLPMPNENIYLVVLLVVSLGGLIPLYGIFIYPFIKKTDMPEVEDGSLLEDIIDTKNLPEVYHEKVRTFLIYELMIPMLLLMGGITVVSLWYGELFGALINLGVTLLLIVVLAIFGHLEVTATKKYLHWHYGPIGKKVKHSEIKSIRSTSIRWFKDFMGWGLKASADGTWGYIASGKVGVRIKLKNGKKYVITVKDPETLVRYVRAARKKK